MAPGLRDQLRSALSRRACAFALIAGAMASLAACSNVSQLWDGPAPAAPPGPPQAPSEIGTGSVHVGLILPLSATGKPDRAALARLVIQEEGHASPAAGGHAPL